MTWDEFEELCELLVAQGKMDNIEDIFLFEKSVLFDNGTRDRVKQTGKTFPATWAAIFGGGNCKGADFVYFHSAKTLQVGTIGTGSAGHPTLAGMNIPNGAGIVLKNGFFFHSGHFRPTLPEGLAFFAAFIRNSCATLAGAARDNLVDQMTQMDLQYYVSPEGGRTVTTSLLRIADSLKPDQGSSRGIPIPMQGFGEQRPQTFAPPKSSPMGIGGSRTTRAPSPVLRPPSPTVDIHSTAVRSLGEETTGVTETGTFFEQGRTQNRAQWMPDATSSKCLICRTNFTLFNRRHHCRKCGRLVCAKCSKTARVVKHPAVENASEAVDVSAGPVRVCDDCKDLRDF